MLGFVISPGGVAVEFFLSDDLVSVDDIDNTNTVTVEAGGEKQVRGGTRIV